MSTGGVLTAEKIDTSIDKGALSTLRFGRSGVQPTSMQEAVQTAKLMAISGQAVPPHCRNNPGLCLAIVIQAAEWNMTPFAVANKSYVVNDRVSYESQLIHAVIEQRAPLQGRLRHTYSGTGAQRKCKIIGRVQGESEPFEYESPAIGEITIKNSPLWKTKPDLQLYYNASRDWARMYFPDVIMGVYSNDEIEDSEQMPQQSERRKIADIVPVATASEIDQHQIESVLESAPQPTFSERIAAAKTTDDLDALMTEIDAATDRSDDEKATLYQSLADRQQAIAK